MFLIKSTYHFYDSFDFSNVCVCETEDAAKQLIEKLNKNELIAHQASKRGGLLKCKVLADKVIISGQAVLYLEGYITI